MPLTKLTTTDAFIASDFADAPGVGITRLARKVLQDGAFNYARSTTYTFAFFGLEFGGASIGINAEGDAIAPAVEAFVAEVADHAADGSLVTTPALGVTTDDLAPLLDASAAARLIADQGSALTAAGALAAAGAVRDGGLDGATVAIDGGGPVVEAATAAVNDSAATLVDGGRTADAEILLVAGKAGALDHEAVPDLRAGIVVPLTPLAVTARAHAELGKAGTIHVPDFLAVAAPLLAAMDPDGGDAVDRVRDAVSGLAGEGTNLWMAAVKKAEDFLRTWRDELPFGRPLA